MRNPHFWYSPPCRRSTVSTLLSPLGQLYGVSTARRVLRSAVSKASVPVICVGNLNVGGTGKTPTVIALTEIAKAQGAKPLVLSRGYRGHLKGPVLVDEFKHEADQTGDEPLLLASFATTIVCKNRVRGIAFAETHAPDIIILDDGFQDPSVEKTKSLIVVDAEHGFGNGLCLPAGPLREPVANGLLRADAVLSIGEVKAQRNFASTWGKMIKCQHMTAELKPVVTGMDWSKGSYIAFAGIGDPDKFFKTLRMLGANLVHTEILGDHATISPRFLKRLRILAYETGAQLVTTEKDVVRLPKNFRGDILSLPVRLIQDQSTSLTEFFKTAMQQ